MTVAAVASSLLVPAGFAQVSSSAEYNEAYQGLVQDQYPNQGGYARPNYNTHHSESWADHLAIEAGAGFTVPVSNTTTWQTVGYNINIGGGWMFTDNLGLLAEWSFNGSSIPTSTLTNVGEPNGNVHVWSLGLAPIYYIKNTGRFGAYATGGGGFYRKLTTFTQPVYVGNYCSYFYGCFPQYQNVTLSHFSSNQGGVNVGGGATFKFNPDGKAKLYAEMRYVWVDSPGSTKTTVGTGAVNMLPITFGFRW